MRSFYKELLLGVLILGVAYAGGYHFGRHPNSLRELLGSKSIVIMTTQENLIPEELQAWLEDKWGHSMIVQVVGEDEIKNGLTQADLLLLPKNRMDALRDQIQERPPEIDTSMILVDLMRRDSRAVPALWSLSSLGDGFYRLHLWEFGWPIVNERSIELMKWILSEEFQEQWAATVEMNPVHAGLLEKLEDAQNLRDIPLEKLRYD